MRIGIDCKSILDPAGGEFAGVGHYTYYLVRHILRQDKENTYILFFHTDTFDFSELERDGAICVRVPFARYKKFLPFIYSHILYPNFLNLYRLDLYHNPANTIPLLYFGKSLITVHDLAIYLHPEWFPARQFFSTRILVPASIRRANRIIVPSENTKKDIVALFRYKNSDAISLVHEGVEDYLQFHVNLESVRPELQNIPHPYFLTLSTIEPRKNITRLIKAFKVFLDEHPKSTMHLYIAGRKGWKYGRVFNTIYRLGLKDRVRYLGYVTLDEKVHLMRHAFSFVFPSLYEGFGLPIVEAMSAGIPIITSNVGSIPELLIDNAVFIDPYDISSIAAGMAKMTEDASFRKACVDRQRGIVQNLTWEHAAEKTIAIYKEME